MFPARGTASVGRNSCDVDAKGCVRLCRSQYYRWLAQPVTTKDKRCFDAVQFADGLEDIMDIKFSEALWCSLIDHVSVPTGGKKSLIFHLRNGGAIDIVLDQ